MDKSISYGRCVFLAEWSDWAADTHEAKEQVDRQGRALRYPFTILALDLATQTARFSSTSDLPHYDTTLCNCTCYDFQERKLPCKHIYRLAKELGIIDIIKRPGGSKDGLYKPEHLSDISSSDDVHSHPEQIKRQQNAKKCQLLSLDKKSQTAEFKGSGKKPYTTTLKTCTCKDFGMRKLPCKHIYKLMLELGIADI